MIAIDDMLDAELRDGTGASVTLRALLGPRATVIVFVRHFG